MEHSSSGPKPNHPTSQRYYLRLSVTDRCNLRCRYCMPAQGIELLPRREVLSLEAIAAMTRRLASVLSLEKVRLTGGEPLIRKGFLSLIPQLTDLPGRPPLLLTTNGTLLEELAGPLRRAGISRVNISLDTLDPERYRLLTRGGELKSVLRGIDAALETDFEMVKLNTVLLGGVNDFEVDRLVRFALGRGLQIRFIERMPTNPWNDRDSGTYLPADTILRNLADTYELEPISSMGTTARMFRVSNGRIEGRIGVITPISHPFCQGCPRLRLDARGRLFPCLMNHHHLDLKEILAAEIPDEHLSGLVERLRQFKRTPGGIPKYIPMSQIGG